MENRFESGIFSEASSYFISDSSDEEDSDGCEDLSVSIKSADNEVLSTEEVNLHYLLMRRENTGHFSGNRRSRQVKRAFTKVPSRLGFCLKDIVPYCYLQGHMFMGLTACGQYLLSYKVCCNESSNANASYFNIGYKYTLYFWIYRPHQPLRRFYKSCLFDDHGADNLKTVTMAQWVTNPRVLIVHGAAENENEESYLTYVKVPKLGCLDCKKLREFDEDGFSRCDALCIKCNLTIHTKYSTTESDPKFDPHINLICPDRVIIIANGFIHMLHVDLESTPHSHHSQSMAATTTAALVRCTPPYEVNQLTKHQSPAAAHSSRQTPSAAEAETETIGCDNTNNIVARIIADFSDIENEVQASNGSAGGCLAGEKNSHRPGDAVKSTKNFDELIFTCALSSGAGSSNSKSPMMSSQMSTTGGNGSKTKVSLINHQGKRNHRIVTKSYRNGITTVDLQGASTSSNGGGGSGDKASAYEFSEDNEKCEKIGTFRKRRLADKKYEFSEDNSENIIPFTKVRMTSQQILQSPTAASRLHRATSHFHSPCVSPSSSTAVAAAQSQSLDGGGMSVPAQVHHYHGFRSPCGSPVSNSMIRSPAQLFQQQKSPPSSTSQQMLNFKPLTTISPLQLSMAKRNHYDIGNMSPTTVPFLSPRRDESKVMEVPLQGGFGQEKPTCTKKFKRRFVEEDDAASVITSEEDDCISPGYHTSLPMEVHGSCYSDMQMISQMSYEKLKCVSVVITQHSFDLETFTYYVISNLCQKNNKIYDVFYDWACELINVCPRSNLISCILMAHFTARDQLPATCNNCLNCSRNLDCVFHRKQFECRILFTWNMELGDWDVLDYGELHEFNRIGQPYESGRTKSSSKSFGGGLAKTAKSLAQELATSLDKLQNFSSNLRVWDSNVSKSKSCLTDLDNVIEFYLKRPRYSE